MQLGWECLSELARLPVELFAHTHTDSWALKLALAWIASPLVCFVCFVLMRRLQKNQRLAPIVLAPAPGTAMPADGSQADLRVAALNMCLLPGGWSFSGRYLLDGDDKKEERIERLLAMMEDYDVLLLNEMWGCWWSSLHTRFFQCATERGFYVCYSRVGILMDSGNVILSRFPLSDASSWTFKNASGWQSLVPNGVLHATCYAPSGSRVHLFTTHLMCTSSPSEDMRSQKVANQREDEDDDTGCLSGVVRALESDIEREAEVRLQQLHELSRFVLATAGIHGLYIAAGDFNIMGGSSDYHEAAKLFGRQSTNSPAFQPTFSTKSFLTPPGWRDVEWEANLDHIFTNIDVKSFDVLPMDMSDHYPLHMVASLPRWPELESCKMELFGCQPSAQELLASWCPTSEGKRVLRELEHPAGAIKKQFARHAVSQVVPLIFAEVPRSP